MTALSDKHPLEAIQIEPIAKDGFAIKHPAGVFDTSWHKHSQHQLIYAEGGVIQIRTASRSFLLPAAHGAWIPSNCEHSLHSAHPNLQVWLIYFQKWEPEWDVFAQVKIFSITPLAREMIYTTGRWSELNAGLDDPLAEPFFLSMRHLAREWCHQPLALALPLSRDPLMFAITAYIQDRLDQTVRLEELAQHFNLSGRTLLRRFKSQLGMSYREYTAIARIVKAVERLTRSSDSITEVAYSVGYRNISAFSHAFTAAIGVSPSVYKQTQQTLRIASNASIALNKRDAHQAP